MVCTDRFRCGARRFGAALGVLGVLSLAACDGGTDATAQAPDMQAAAAASGLAEQPSTGSSSTASTARSATTLAGTTSTAGATTTTAPRTTTVPSSTPSSTPPPSSTTTTEREATSAFTTSTLLAADPARVAQAQRLLLARGFAIGEADGDLGPVTAAAVTEFQRSAGLTPSGTLDEPTFSALERSSRHLQDELPASVLVDLSEQHLYVHNKAGELVTFWPISTGAPGNETPTGSFNVQARLRVGTALDAETVHMDFFTVFNGHIGFHGIPWVGTRDDRLWTPLGEYGVSHGCIRMQDANAEYLYTFLADGAEVVVRD